MGKNANEWKGFGRLGKDPEMQYLANGTEVTRASIATETGYGDKKTTTWIPLTFFGKSAELADRILKKGMKIIASGRLDINNKQQEDGAWKTYVSVIVDSFDVLDWGKDGGPKDGSYVNEDDIYVGSEDDDEDIPF